MPARAPIPRLLAASIALLAGFAAAGGASAPERLDLAVKATYLYKLAPFVDWPPGVSPGADGAFDICVVGDDPFGPVLDRAVAGQQVGGHPIVLRRLPAAARDSGCEIMFIAGSRGQSVKDALRLMHGAPVLTVTDDQSSRGVVDFVIDQGRVHFRIDDDAAADDGLTISSKLLSLAVAVNPRRGGGSRR
jgi:hypothetical protein